METIGQRIAAQRHAKRIKQETLAQALGISQSILSDIETDKISPKWETIVAVAEKLDIPLAQLLPQDTYNIMNNSNNQNVFGSLGTQNNYFPEEERTFYKETIADLKAQNSKLMSLLEKLSDKLG